MSRHSQLHRTTASPIQTKVAGQQPAAAIWSALNPAQQEFLQRHQVVRSYGRGEVIYEAGTACTGLISVTAGTLLIERQSHANPARRLRLVEPGEMAGWSELFGDGTHNTRALCMTDVTVSVIPAKLVQELVKSQPLLGLNLLSLAAQDLERIERTALEHTQDSARQRLARVLAALKDQHGEGQQTGEIDIELPMSRRDLADLIAVRPETLSRLIRELETDGVAAFGFRSVRIPDLDLLLDELESETEPLEETPSLVQLGRAAVHPAAAQTLRVS